MAEKLRSAKDLPDDLWETLISGKLHRGSFSVDCLCYADAGIQWVSKNGRWTMCIGRRRIDEGVVFYKKLLGLDFREEMKEEKVSREEVLGEIYEKIKNWPEGETGSFVVITGSLGVIIRVKTLSINAN